MPVAKGYPRSVKYKGKRFYVLHKGGKRYTARQLRTYYATGGWERKPRTRRKKRRAT